MVLATRLPTPVKVGRGMVECGKQQGMKQAQKGTLFLLSSLHEDFLLKYPSLQISRATSEAENSQSFKILKNQIQNA